MNKFILFFIFGILIPFTTAQDDCGKSCTFSYSDNETTLNINAVVSITSINLTEWQSKPIKKISITGKCSVYGNAFKQLNSLETVEFLGDINQLQKSAFYSCGNLKTVTFHGNVDSFQQMSFNNCSKLEKIYYNGNSHNKC